LIRAGLTILAVATPVFFGMQAIEGSYADLMVLLASAEQMPSWPPDTASTAYPWCDISAG
jgi:hypothetical protein